MKSNKSILHVVNIYFVLPYFIGDQFIYFKDNGYDLHVICSPSEHIQNYAIEKKFSYKEVPILRSISIIQDIKSIVSICKYIKSNKIGIVCGHTPKGALLSIIAGFLMRVPIRIYFRHGLVYETSNGFKRKFLIFLDRMTAKLATKIVCVSPSVFKRSIEDGLNSKNKQTLLFHGTCNGIDVVRFSRLSIVISKQNELRKVLGIPENTFVVGFTGRLVRDKGIIELVEAFELITNKYKNIYLLLVGMIEERDALPFNTIRIINENPCIISTGFIENAEIEYYYSLMNIFALPSYREGFPTSVLEASSMELPVITTKVTGCIDSIIENETGVFIEHNPNELADAIKGFIIDDKKRKEFGQSGRRFVSKYFEQKLIWECIEKLYYK